MLHCIISARTDWHEEPSSVWLHRTASVRGARRVRTRRKHHHDPPSDLGQRLFLLVSLPLLGMVGYAALTAWAHWQEAVNMRGGADRSSTRSGDVIHLMAGRRGASVTGDQALLWSRRAVPWMV